MKLGILHISDVHIKETNYELDQLAESISKKCFESAREVDHFIIVVTGDIAYSGLGKEYEIAEIFLQSLKDKIGRETTTTPEIILCPGNHDCDLSQTSRIREIAIQSIKKNASEASEKEVQEVCSAPQSAFFEFRNRITLTKPKVDNRLYTEYEIFTDSTKVTISSINAAWMTTIPEKQGELIFPTEQIQNHLKSPTDFRIALIHHPLNWYCQSTYHPLRKALTSSCNIIMSGHEHTHSSGTISRPRSGGIVFFESSALQPHDANEPSGFSCLLIDINERIIREKTFTIKDKIVQNDRHDEHEILQDAYLLPDSHQLTTSFEKYLADPGGNFTHPGKNNLTAEDIFVYPEIERKSLKSKATTNSAELLDTKKFGSKIFLIGDDKSGKTFLLNRIFLDAHKLGKYPLYLKANEFKSVSDNEIKAKISSTEKKQYVNSAFTETPKNQNIALIDDADSIPGGIKNLSTLITALEKHFSKIIITGTRGIELSELIDSDAAEILRKYVNYEIKSFGYSMRHKLIMNWCNFGSEVETKSQLAKKVHELESLMGGVLGKNLIPSRPIYLIILLQSSERSQQGELQSSSFSYYYQYLITKGLQQEGVLPDELNETFNYLAHLAWEFKLAGEKEISPSRIRDFNNKFSDKFTKIDLEKRIRLLVNSKIIRTPDGHYSFFYPYIYYFFIGKYLADHLHETEIQKTVSNYCRSLNKREHSSSILFLTHHRNDPDVIDQISNCLQECFSEYKPLSLNGDTEKLNQLVESSTKLVMESPNVALNQEKQRLLADQINDAHEESDLNEDLSETIDLSAKFNTLIKTSEILGQIVKNYYGSIERDKKKIYLSETINAPLRLLRLLFDEIIADPHNFASEIEKQLKKQNKSIENDSTRLAKKIAFDMTGFITTGIIVATASFVSSEKLQADIEEVVSLHGENSHRLIGIASRLIQPGQIPFEDIRKIGSEFRSNIFAFTVLQSLVAYHLHMFHTSEKDKQRLCSFVDIDIKDARKIDNMNKKSKHIQKTS